VGDREKRQVFVGRGSGHRCRIAHERQAFARDSLAGQQRVEDQCRLGVAEPGFSQGVKSGQRTGRPVEAGEDGLLLFRSK
jgi:hypothetical protein